MSETIAGILFWVSCNFLYYAGAVVLLVKNRRRTEVRIVGVGAILIGPLLLLLPTAQLAFVIPLYSIFIIHGPTLPQSLPTRTVLSAMGATFLGIGLVIWVIAAMS